MPEEGNPELDPEFEERTDRAVQSDPGVEFLDRESLSRGGTGFAAPNLDLTCKPDLTQ